jgi:2-dehydropantoate 2-reductase
VSAGRFSILVLGAGAMGSYFGASLAEQGFPVTLVDVNDAHLGAIAASGLRLVTDAGERFVRLNAMRAEAVTERPDLVIVFTKTMHTRAALASVKPLLGPETWVLSLQNGLGNREAIEEFAPASRIAIGVTTVPADLKGPGHVESHGASKTRLMAADGQPHPMVERIRDAIVACDLPCAIDPDVIVAIWEKVAFNAALNAICAVARCRVGDISGLPEGRTLALAVADEAAQVAQARGIRVDRAGIAATVTHALDNHQKHIPSMGQDMLAGRPTEVDAINGAVVKAAEGTGVAVPLTRMLAVLVRISERRTV